MGKQRKNLQKGHGCNLEGTNMLESYLQIRGYLQKKYQIDNLEQIKGINFLKDLLIKNITWQPPNVSMNLFSLF